MKLPQKITRYEHKNTRSFSVHELHRRQLRWQETKEYNYILYLSCSSLPFKKKQKTKQKQQPTPGLKHCLCSAPETNTFFFMTPHIFSVLFVSHFIYFSFIFLSTPFHPTCPFLTSLVRRLRDCVLFLFQVVLFLFFFLSAFFCLDLAWFWSRLGLHFQQAVSTLSNHHTLLWQCLFLN